MNDKILKIEILAFWLLIFPVFAYNQGLQGVYLGRYGSEILTNSLEQINKPTDTTYSNLHVILDFEPTNNVIVKFIGGKSYSGKYQIENNIVSINSEFLNMKGKMDDKNYLLLNDKVSPAKSYFFEKLTPEFLKNQNLDSTILSNTEWDIEIKDEGQGVFQFFFKPENELIIKKTISNNFTNNNYEITRRSRYCFDSYYGIHFIILLNNFDGMFNQRINIYEFTPNKISSEIINYNSDFMNCPEPKEVSLIKKEKLNIDSLYSAINLVLGEWIYKGSTLAASFLRYNEINFKEYDLTLEKNMSFSLEYKYYKHGSILSDSIIGDWEMNITGDYITLKTDNKKEAFVSIKKESQSSIKLFLETPKIEIEKLALIDMIELEKNNWP